MPQDQSPPASDRDSTGWTLGQRSVFAVMLLLMAFALVQMVNMLNWVAVLHAAANLPRLFERPWRFPIEAFRGLMAGGGVLVAVFGVGYGAIHSVRPWRRMLPLPAERLALAPLVGAVPLSLIVLGLGLAGWANPAAYGALLALSLVPAAVGLRALAHDLIEWRTRRKRTAGALPRQFLPPQPLVRFLQLLLLLTALMIVPYTLSPSVESDELRYHLAAPATWLREGRIHYLPYQAFSNFPMLGEMLFMWAMALGGEAAAKLVHLGFLPGNMLLVGLFCLRLIKAGRPGFAPATRRAVWIASASVPLIATVSILASWAFLEMFMIGYHLAFIYLTGRALARPRRAAGALVGVIGGGALGIKYTFFPLMAGLGALWTVLLALDREGRRRAVRLATAAALVALLLASPWLIKNIVWTGNPVYWLAWPIFHGGEWSQANSIVFSLHAGQKGLHLAGLTGVLGKGAELLLSPLAVTYLCAKFEDHFIGPLPLMMLLLALGGVVAGWLSARPTAARPPNRAWARRWRLWFVLNVLVAWVFWFAGYQSTRFLLPAIALVLAAGGWALARWERLIPAWARPAPRILLAFGMVYSFAYIYTDLFTPPKPDRVNRSDAVAVALGFERPADYLAGRLNYWRGAQWLARHAARDEKTLLVGEHRTMHFQTPVVASDFFDTPQPIPWLRQSPDNDQMLDALLRAHVRWIFLNTGEWLASPQSFQFLFVRRLTPHEAPTLVQRFEDLWNNPRLRQVYDQPGDPVRIYEILPRAAANSHEALSK